MTAPWCPSSHTPDGTECVVCGWSCPEMEPVDEGRAVDFEGPCAAVGWCAPSDWVKS